MRSQLPSSVPNACAIKPNKPMVLTVLATTEERSPGSVRQHIGEPLGRERRGYGQ